MFVFWLVRAKCLHRANPAGNNDVLCVCLHVCGPVLCAPRPMHIPKSLGDVERLTQNSDMISDYVTTAAATP